MTGWQVRFFTLLIIITSVLSCSKGKQTGVLLRLAAKVAVNTSASDTCILLLNNAKTDDETLEALAYCANSNKELADIIIPQVMSTLSNDEYKHINDLKATIGLELNKKGIDKTTAKAFADEWIQENVKTQFEGVKDLIKKDLTHYIDSISIKGSPNN